jgi:hypothetical protein
LKLLAAAEIFPASTGYGQQSRKMMMMMINGRAHQLNKVVTARNMVWMYGTFYGVRSMG